MLSVSALVDVQLRVEDPPGAIDDGLADMLTVGRELTVTVALEVAVPPEPFTVMIYVVVTDGVTLTEPFASTVPMPLLMLAVSASLEVQLSTEDPPSLMVSGDADMLTVGPWDTIIVAVSVTTPPSPIALMVYVVVTAGDTFFHPSSASSPMPPSMLTSLAPVEFQKITLCSPETIASGDAVMFAAMES